MRKNKIWWESQVSQVYQNTGINDIEENHGENNSQHFYQGNKYIFEEIWSKKRKLEFFSFEVLRRGHPDFNPADFIYLKSLTHLEGKHITHSKIV